VFPLESKKEDLYLHPDLVFWTFTHNGYYNENFGRFGQIYGRKDVHLGVNGNPGCKATKFQ